MSNSHETSCSVTQANESAGYVARSGPSWRSWAVVSGWIMMMVIRKDPEKPIDLSSMWGGKNVLLMWRFENLAFAPTAPMGRASRTLTDRWERNVHSISLAEPEDGPRSVERVPRLRRAASP